VTSMESDLEDKKSKAKSLKSGISDIGKTERKADLSLKDVIKLTPHFDGTNFTFKEWADTLERNLALANVGDNLGEILFGSILINKAKIVWEMVEVGTRISIKLSLKRTLRQQHNSFRGRRENTFDQTSELSFSFGIRKRTNQKL